MKYSLWLLMVFHRNEDLKPCEGDLKYAKQSVMRCISDLRLDENEVKRIISSYPPEAQVKFCKNGGQYVVASK